MRQGEAASFTPGMIVLLIPFLTVAIMSSDSNFGATDEQIVYVLSSSLNAIVLDVLAYGIYTAVYFVALYIILALENSHRIGSAILITAMWILVTIQTIIIWISVDDMFIKHGETRVAQFVASLSYQDGHSISLVVINGIMSFLNVLLADMVMIWRCWVLYGKNWLIIIIPLTSFGALSVCYIWRTILTYRSFSKTPNQLANPELLYVSATVFTNIFCTTAIIYRIARVSGWRASLKTYRGLMEILVESSLLYAAINAIRIGLQVYSQYISEELDVRYFFPRVIAISITGLAPTLIIARVAAGYARPNETWMCRTSLPDMRSTMRSLAETLHFAQPVTGTVTANNVDLERSIASEASGVEVNGRHESGSKKTELGQS